jgi:hypothetical protein
MARTERRRFARQATGKSPGAGRARSVTAIEAASAPRRLRSATRTIVALTGPS